MLAYSPLFQKIISNMRYCGRYVVFTHLVRAYLRTVVVQYVYLNNIYIWRENKPLSIALSYTWQWSAYDKWHGKFVVTFTNISLVASCVHPLNQFINTLWSINRFFLCIHQAIPRHLFFYVGVYFLRLEQKNFAKWIFF